MLWHGKISFQFLVAEEVQKAEADYFRRLFRYGEKMEEEGWNNLPLLDDDLLMVDLFDSIRRLCP